jgi:hypothetical protein
MPREMKLKTITIEDDGVTDEVIYVAHKTFDYEKFQFLEGNRDISIASVNQLKKSFISYGSLRQPILVNENYEIIEGQHRYMACKELGIPIEYVIQEGAKVSTCVPLNSGRHNWQSKNYVHLYAQKSTGYTYFEELLNTYHFTPRVTYVALGEESYRWWC